MPEATPPTQPASSSLHSVPSGETVEVARPEMNRQVRHDMRGYLNQIIGYSDLLTDEATDRQQPDLVPDLQRIYAAGKQLLELVNTYVDPVSRRADNATRAEGAADSQSIFASPGTSHTGLPTDAPPLPESTSLPEVMVENACVLIVDDSPENRDLLRRQLERHGYGVSEAESGQQALDSLRESPCDVVLLDVILPGINGYQVLQSLKADSELQLLPVIMISALDEMDSVVRCIELGAEDYLPKPFNPTLLQARVGASLEKKRLRDRERHLLEQVQSSYHQLQEAQRLRDDMADMIVHDLRTPLTSLLTGLQTLDAIGNLDADQQEFLQIAVSGGETLLGMINDLLDIGKMEDGSLKLDYADVNASLLIATAQQQVASLAQEKTIALATRVAEGTPLLIADEDKLRRTLVNLLGNALKFTPVGGKVTVSVRPDAEAQTVIFSVADTGEGIPREMFGRIFEKFGQVEGRKAGRKMSTGLGLTFCKMAVEAHGGTIWVESEPGAGSTFSFRLPLAPA